MMWVIQINVPYEGMHEEQDMTTEEVLKFLGSARYDFDQMYIRPSTRSYDPWDFIKEYKK